MTTARVSLGIQSDKSVAEYEAIGRAAEDFGLWGVSVFNDLGFQPALFPLLTMARVTRRLTLGAACHNPYLTHPVEIAGQVAALDAASSGRAYAGVARGSWLSAVGVAQGRPLATLEDTVEIVRRLLAGDDRGYQGRAFSIAPGFVLQHQPLRPRVPVLLGVWGEKGTTLAARVADQVKIGGCANPDMVRLMRKRLEAAGGGQVELCTGAVTVVDEDGDAARARARLEVSLYLPVVAALDPTLEVPADLIRRTADLVAQGRATEAGNLLPDDLLHRFCFCGTPEEVADHAVELFAAGADRVEFGTPHGLTDLGGITLLGQRVLPALRAGLELV